MQEIIPSSKLARIRKRLISKRRILKSGCWKWTGATNDFKKRVKQYPNNLIYGHIGVGSSVRKVHRVSWEVFRGKIPTGLKVLHKCDVPLCFNPRHLFLGTQKQNVDDMLRKGRSIKMTRAKGYSNPNWVVGEKNPRAILTNQAIRKIRALYKPFSRNFNQAVLAKKFGVGKTIIGDVILKKRWRHVK